MNWKNVVLYGLIVCQVWRERERERQREKYGDLISKGASHWRWDLEASPT